MNDSLWLAWSADPTALIGIPLAAILYARGLRSLERRRIHDGRRTASFYIGLIALFIALVSPLDALSDELFLAHMGQHMLLMFFAVPAIQIGAPVIPLMRGIPRPLRKRVAIPIFKSPFVRCALRNLFRPLIAWPLFIGLLMGWHVPAAYEAALNNEAVHLIEHFTFALGAYLWWWNVIDPAPLRASLSYLARVPFVFITIVPTFVLGAFLTFAPNAFYPHYELTAPAYGITALEDQEIGGVIMWIPGSFVVAAALLLSLYYAVRYEQQAFNSPSAQEVVGVGGGSNV